MRTSPRLTFEGFQGPPAVVPRQKHHPPQQLSFWGWPAKISRACKCSTLTEGCVLEAVPGRLVAHAFLVTVWLLFLSPVSCPNSMALGTWIHVHRPSRQGTWAWLALPFKVDFFVSGTKSAQCFGPRAQLRKAADGKGSQLEHRALRSRPWGGTDGSRWSPLLGESSFLFLGFLDSQHWEGPPENLQSGSLSQKRKHLSHQLVSSVSQVGSRVSAK